jgi:hypothetical protein
LKINLVQYKSGGKRTKAAKVAAGSERIMVEEVATTDKDVIVVEDTVVEEIIEVFIMGMDTAEVDLLYTVEVVTEEILLEVEF